MKYVDKGAKMKQKNFIKRTFTVILTVKHFMDRLSKDKVNAYSAQAAFFIIISFFPFTMLLLTLLNYMPFTAAQAEYLTFEFLSPPVSELINSVLNEIYQKASGAVISITSITALWSASKGLLAIVDGLNSVYGVTEKRGFIKLRLITVFYMLVFIIILIIALALLVFGGSINNWLVSNIPGFENVTFALLGFRWLIALCLFTLFFMFLYTVIPERKTRFVSELPGAFFSACGWLIFSALYSFYIENFGNFSYLYGSLTAVVLLMLWLYFCMYIVFVGAEINDFLQDENIGAVFKKWFNAKKIEKKKSKEDL